MKKYLPKLALGVASSGAMLLLLEVLLRLTDAVYEPQYDDRVKIIQPAANPAIGWELIPNFEGRALGGFVSVNSLGLRGPEVEVAKPEGTTRVAMVGDSWTFGWGVDQEHVVSARLAESLDRARAPGAFEVLNFSVYGYNLQQLEAVLVEKALRFEPDVVILAFNINDLEGLRLGPDVGPPVAPPWGVFTLLQRAEELANRHSHALRLIATALRGLAVRLSLGSSTKLAYYSRHYEDGSPELGFLTEAFGRIGSLAREHGLVICVVYTPWMNDLTEANPYRASFAKVRSLAEREGLRTLDLFPHYVGRDVDALRISAIDGHPTPLGHEIATDPLAEFVLDHAAP